MGSCIAVPNLGLIEDFGSKRHESHNTAHHIADTTGISIQLFVVWHQKKKKKKEAQYRLTEMEKLLST